jgi:predicted transcriptional regulator
MNVEESLLKEEQERTLTWAIENLEKQREGIQGRISNASGEFQDIKSRLDDIASVIDEMNSEKSAVDKKIDVAMQRMAILDNPPVPDISTQDSIEQPEANGDFDDPHFAAPLQHSQTSGQHSTLKVNCRANTIELVRQIAMRTGVSESTIMENAVASVALAIQKNKFRMHFPLNVKLVNYDD